MWQEIAIILIGLLTIGYVGWKIYSALTRPSRPGDSCAGCKGCSLKEEIRKNANDQPKECNSSGNHRAIS